MQLLTGDGPGLIEAPAENRRILGRYRGARPGPLMIVLGGIHGNEPAGLAASRRLLARLDRERPELCGELVVVTGNRRALGRRVRFIDKDLNRQWTEEKLSAALQNVDTNVVEDVEQRELFAVVRELTLAASGPVYFLDQHTSSADGPPFVTIGDTLRNREFARRFPLPVILGLEEQVDGAMLEYMNNRGHITLGVEAGHHDRGSSVDHHEAVLWLALRAAGMLGASPGAASSTAPFERRLLEASRGIPGIIEVRHRHAVERGDGFVMEPGFRNFQAITKGQLLARDRNGDIRAPESGLILLPLYQGQGDDGFFVAREVRPFWLRLSASLRRLRADRFIHLLPGVHQDPHRAASLVVDTRIARWYPLEVFHLLGYRKRRQDGARLLVSRRRYDLAPPERS